MLIFLFCRVNNAKARLLSIEELDKRLTEYGVDTNEINRGTFFGFDFEKDLAPNASYLISLNEVPSAEGPLLAPGQSVVFSTYPKFGYATANDFLQKLTFCKVFFNPIIRCIILALLGKFTSQTLSTTARSTRS